MDGICTDKGKQFASYDQKSGVQFDKLAPLLGGMPPKKDIDAIDKANMPTDAPGSYAASGK